MDILRIIAVSLSAAVISIGIGAFVSSYVAKQMANITGYPNLTACVAGGDIACSAISTAMSAFIIAAGFFGIVTIALLGWYIVGLFGGQGGGKSK